MKARICSSGSFEWRPPQEELTSQEQVLALVETISSLDRRGEQDGFCPAVGGLGFTILLSMRDGTVLSVSGDTGGCGTVEAGEVEYNGAKEVLDDFVDRIEAQRAGKEKPPGGIPNAPLDCNAVDNTVSVSPSLTGSLADGVRAVSCWHPDAPSAPPWRSADVPRRALDVLLSDLARNTVAQEHFKAPACGGQFEDYYNQMLLVQTRWGDVLRVGGVCEEYQVEEGRFWHPGPRARRILAALRR